MHLIVGAVSLSLLVHDEDALLLLVVVLGNSDPDARDDRGERPGDSLLYHGNHRTATISIVTSPCQLGFALQLLEEDGSGIAAHLHALHCLLVLLFTGRVTECGLEFEDEVVPVGISESGSRGVSIVVDPKVFATMGPPVLGAFYEERGRADHHKGWDSSELVAVRLEVGVAVTEESVHVIMFPLERFG